MRERFQDLMAEAKDLTSEDEDDILQEMSEAIDDRIAEKDTEDEGGSDE